ncbi:hypothetical protein [Methylobacterium sp. 37f]|uniref:hypothetical protein n=1 Tax=Methylobacterium sp. 37f TaxID=2817058 RepID=UPI001FFD0651|nr:hypothetical protein [Methylobacterium sp. 37f]MCK2054271.1 hypothetical protein [Methylobacterium sp. 37f]
MSEIEDKRHEIAELIALELGFGDLDAASAADRAVIERQTDETIAGCAADSQEPADCTEANIRLRGLLHQYRALQILRDDQVLRSDEADARLAEEGEVFSREDDA